MVVYASLGSIVASGLLSNCETIKCKDHLVLWKNVQNKKCGQGAYIHLFHYEPTKTSGHGLIMLMI
jgi:hypothetical protein